MGSKVDMHITVLKANNNDLAGTTDVFEAVMNTEWAVQRELEHPVQIDNTKAMFGMRFAPNSSHDCVMLTLLRDSPLYWSLQRVCEVAIDAAITEGAAADLLSCVRQHFHASVKPT